MMFIIWYLRCLIMKAQALFKKLANLKSVNIELLPLRNIYSCVDYNKRHELVWNICDMKIEVKLFLRLRIQNYNLFAPNL